MLIGSKPNGNKDQNSKDPPALICSYKLHRCEYKKDSPAVDCMGRIYRKVKVLIKGAAVTEDHAHTTAILHFAHGLDIKSFGDFKSLAIDLSIGSNF